MVLECCGVLRGARRGKELAALATVLQLASAKGLLGWVLGRNGIQQKELKFLTVLIFLVYCGTAQA